MVANGDGCVASAEMHNVNWQWVCEQTLPARNEIINCSDVAVFSFCVCETSSTPILVSLTSSALLSFEAKFRKGMENCCWFDGVSC
jgi:hypothetical protein